jgi:predicted kinase
VPFLFVECRADPEVCRARLRARANRPGISDAREPLWDEFAARWEPVDDLPPGEHVVLDTDRPLTGARLDRLPAPG